MLRKKIIQKGRETNLVTVLVAIALLAAPILEFIFKQSCVRVTSLHNIAFFAWMHWVARPFFLSICLTLSFFISKLPFSVSQILLRSPTTKNKTMITSTLDLMKVFCWFDKEGGVFWKYKSKSIAEKSYSQYARKGFPKMRIW